MSHKQIERPLIPLGTRVEPWGVVEMVGTMLGGERYYGLRDGQSVAMMPADVVERNAASSPTPDSRATE